MFSLSTRDAPDTQTTPGVGHPPKPDASNACLLPAQPTKLEGFSVAARFQAPVGLTLVPAINRLHLGAREAEHLPDAQVQLALVLLRIVRVPKRVERGVEHHHLAGVDSLPELSVVVDQQPGCGECRAGRRVCVVARY